MAIIDFSTTGYYLITEDVPLSNSEVAIGKDSILCFRGGRLVNDTDPKETITLKGDNITIEAGPVQIFEGPFDFKASDGVNQHYWNMECAYPQWFGAKSCADKITSSLIDNESEAPDSSEAINAAIRLKRVGKVKIPAGIYKITRFINVSPGIILEGETPRFSGVSRYGTVLFPWHKSGHSLQSIFSAIKLYEDPDDVPVSKMDFPPHPSDVNWYNRANGDSCDCGYMMLVGIADSCSMTFEAGKQYPKTITYATDTARQPQVVGTEIKNIAFTTKLNNVSEHRYMRAILMGGAVKLSQVRVYELSQLCCSMSFSDQRYVERCSFAPPAFTQGTEGSPYNWGEYPQKIYAIDLEGGGDAMNIIGNHVATYSEKIGSLKVRSCNGGSITGNILNSDVLIELCRGIDFAGNHMEYGSRLTIASSAVTVRSNFIWRGEKAAITIRRWDNGGSHFYHSPVTLDNNQLFWRRQHYKIDSQGEVQHSGLPQAASFLFRYDVVTDGYSAISVNNTFRNCNRDGYGEESYFGFLMGWLEMKGDPNNKNLLKEEDAYTTVDGEYAAGTDYARITDFEEFNRVSHIASLGSKVQGRSVTPIPSTIASEMFDYWRDETGTDSIEMQLFEKKIEQGFIEADGWKAETGVPVDYEAWIFADYKRRILMREHIALASVYHQDSTLRTPSARTNYRIAIGNGKDLNSLTDYSTNYNVPSGPYMCFMVRIAQNGETIISRKGVLLPICNSTQLWDDGKYLSGFEWAAITPTAINALSSSSNLRPTRISYHGDNVECLIDYDITYLPDTGILMVNGEWTEGDIIRRIGAAGAVARSWIFNGLSWDEL